MHHQLTATLHWFKLVWHQKLQLDSVKGSGILQDRLNATDNCRDMSRLINHLCTRLFVCDGHYTILLIFCIKYLHFLFRMVKSLCLHAIMILHFYSAIFLLHNTNCLNSPTYKKPPKWLTPPKNVSREWRFWGNRPLIMESLYWWQQNNHVLGAYALDQLDPLQIELK